MSVIPFRTLADGSVCCSTYTATGERVAPLYPCSRCAEHFAELDRSATTYAPPDPYAIDLAALRAAAQNRETPEQKFEREYRAARLRDLADEARRTA